MIKSWFAHECSFLLVESLRHRRKCLHLPEELGRLMHCRDVWRVKEMIVVVAAAAAAAAAAVGVVACGGGGGAGVVVDLRA